MIIMAIDPGISGGLAWSNGEDVKIANMPDTPHEIRDLVIEVNPNIVVLEDVGYHIMGNNASASAKFAKHCGIIEGILVGLLIAYVKKSPNEWQKVFERLPKQKKDRKTYIKQSVQGLYPLLEVTLKTADALGILYWAKQQGLSI